MGGEVTSRGKKWKGKAEEGVKRGTTNTKDI